AADRAGDVAAVACGDVPDQRGAPGVDAARGVRAGDHLPDHRAHLLGDLGQGLDAGHDPRLGDPRLGLEAPPRLAARRRRRTRPALAAQTGQNGDASTRSPNVQRILPRGEIEGLDRTRIPRLRMPERAGVFSDRAARLRSLAGSSPIGDYLGLMARLADAQQRALKEFTPPEPDPARVEQAREHNMPPLQPASAPRDAPAWRALLGRLLDDVLSGEGLPDAAAKTCTGLLQKLGASPGEVEDIADALLSSGYDSVEVDAA